MKPYDGYLTPHLKRIKTLASLGKSPVEIAETLYDVYGVRSPNYPFHPRDRIIYTFAALIRHMYRDTPIWWPYSSASNDDLTATARDYSRARREHAFMLRCEGLTLAEAGAHIGVNKERARQLALYMARALGWAMRRTRWTIE